jgi:hypothetical protein
MILREMTLNKYSNISGVEGIIMFFYLSYTKITLYLEITKLKLMLIDGYGILNR